MSESYLRYWGKAGNDGSYHLLAYHCLDVAAVGSVLLRKDHSLLQKLMDISGADRHTIADWLVFFLGIHDIGKFSDGFQNLRSDLFLKLQERESTKGYSIRHDSLGFALWEQCLWEVAWQEKWLGPISGESRHWKRLFNSVARSATGHHGTPPQVTGANNLRISMTTHFVAENLVAAEAFARDTAKTVQGRKGPLSITWLDQLPKNFTKVSWFLAGLSVLCDWIGSGGFPPISQPMVLAEYWSRHALPQAESAVDQAGVLPAKPSLYVTPSSLFPSVATFSPLQQYVAECSVAQSPQLFVLEDMTGSGKTEAALILAQRLIKEGRGDGVFIALPTMATSNAMYDRLRVSYRKLFEDDSFPSLVLSHSARHLSEAFCQTLSRSDRNEQREYGQGEDTGAAYCAAWLADNRKKAFLADAGVGTIDQALLAVLPARHQSLRLFGLARHVLIVDEVHAYDPYMHTLLRNLLEFQAALGGSAILLSATLPFRMRQELAESFARGAGRFSPNLQMRDAYPLVTHVAQGNLQEVPVSARENRRIVQPVELVSSEQKVRELIIQASAAGRCVCWIRNTVHDAVQSYEMLRGELSADLLSLFHARFAMGDRLEKEKLVCEAFGLKGTAETRKGKVIIATQVVEQSLDLDFDLLISDLAPVDLLIQRAGRLRRHSRDSQGNLLNDGATDQRDMTPLYVHSPIPTEDAGGNWYKSAFPKGAFVYPSHGQLWLTARILGERKGWRMPQEARFLVESVYSLEQKERIPEPLRKRDDDEEFGRRSAARMLADLNKLKLEDGYAATPNQWLDDTRTPTRLGEIQTTLRLVRWDGQQLRPLYPEGDFPWDMSQVNVRATKVKEEVIPTDPEQRKAVESLKERLPDRGKWSVLVVLTANANGGWLGKARDPRGEVVSLLYRKETGLETSWQGETDGIEPD